MNHRRTLWSFCGLLAIGLASAYSASAAPITMSLTVMVYQFCDDNGDNCAALGPSGDPYYALETNEIWAQAGISVVFDLVAKVDSTYFSYIDDSVPGDGFQDLDSYFGGPSTTTVDMFLVHTAASPPGSVLYGEGYGGYGGLVIAMDSVLSFTSGLPADGGIGRIDTIAHELGHNLGLVPPSLGGDAGWHSPQPYDNYLMASGGWRDVPGTAANIYPNGLQYDLIPQDQIDLARQSSLLRDIVPEPGTAGLVFGALAGAAALFRRRISPRLLPPP